MYQRLILGPGDWNGKERTNRRCIVLPAGGAEVRGGMLEPIEAEGSRKEAASAGPGSEDLASLPPGPEQDLLGPQDRPLPSCQSLSCLSFPSCKPRLWVGGKTPSGKWGISLICHKHGK